MSIDISNLTAQCTPGDRAPHPPVWYKYKEYFQYFDTEVPAPYPTWEVALKCTTYAVAMALGIVGNMAVLLILALNKNMRTSTNVYIANLAVSDLMVCLWCMWIHLGSNITTSWPFGEFFCRCYSFIQGWMAMASILILLVISCDRFFAIIYPLRARMTRMRCVLLIAVVWIASAAISAPNLLYNVMYDIQWANWREVWCEEEWPTYWFLAVNEDGEEFCSTYSPARTAYLISTVVLLYVLPVLGMSLAYSMIAAKLWTRRVPGEQSYNTLHVQHKSRRKVVRMLIVVLLAFALCWTPFHCMRLYDVMRDKNQDAPPDYVIDLKYAFTYLAYFNSAINPILYAGLNDNFRKGFSQLLRCATCRRNAIAPIGQITANDGTLMFRHTKITSLKLKLGFRQSGASNSKQGSKPKPNNSEIQNNKATSTEKVTDEKSMGNKVFCSIDALDDSSKDDGGKGGIRKITEIAAVIQVEDVDSHYSIQSMEHGPQSTATDMCTLNVPMLEYRKTGPINKLK